MEEIIMKQNALNCAEHGLMVFPVVTNGTTSFGNWNNIATSNQMEINNWWTKFPQYNIGIKTGDGTGIIVLTFPSVESYEIAEGKGLPLTPVATNGKSYFAYFKYQDDMADKFDLESFPDIKISNHGWVLAPPSIVKDASRLFDKPEVYSWCSGKSIDDVPFAEVPNWILKADHFNSELPDEEEPIAQVEDVTDTIEQDTVAEVSNPLTDNKPDPVINDWKAPKLFDKYNVEEIKAELLPSWLGDFAKAISESKQTPEGLAVMLGLSMIATCVQKKFVVAPYGDEEYVEPLALWTVTVLKSGERKSQVLSPLMEPINCWQREQAELLKDRIFETNTEISIAQGRIEALHKEAIKQEDATERQNRLNQINVIKRNMPVAIKAPVLWTSDITAEELQEKLVEQGERMAVLADEGNIFAVMAGLYNDNKVNMDIFLQAYSGVSTRVDRRSRKAELKNPALSFGVTVQPTVIKAFTNGSQKQFKDKGAMARFLYCIPESMLGKRDSGKRIRVSEDIKARYQAGIKRLLNIPTPEEPTMLTLGNEAYEVWLSFDRKVERTLAPGGELSDMNDWGSKLAGNMLRISGLMHLVEHGTDSTVIGKDTMAKAVHLCELLIQHAKAAYGMAGAIEPNADAKKVFEWIKAGAFNAFTKTDCHNHFKNKPWNKEKLDAALAELEERHFIRSVHEQTLGRTLTSYISNPALT